MKSQGHFPNKTSLDKISSLLIGIVNIHKTVMRMLRHTSGQYPLVWFGVMTTLVVTKNAPFSAGGTT